MTDILKTLATAISGIAPTLATMLGGPLAGGAVAALEGAFGLAQGSGASEITKVMQTGSMTPDIIAKVREADQHHAEIIGQQGLDLAKLNAAHQEAFAALETQDRESARNLQVQVHSIWPGILSAITTAAVLAVIGFRMYGSAMPQDAVTVQLIGSLTTGWGLCLAYWFGSTRQGAVNQNALAEIAKSS